MGEIPMAATPSSSPPPDESIPPELAPPRPPRLLPPDMAIGVDPSSVSIEASADCSDSPNCALYPFDILSSYRKKRPKCQSHTSPFHHPKLKKCSKKPKDARDKCETIIVPQFRFLSSPPFPLSLPLSPLFLSPPSSPLSPLSPLSFLVSLGCIVRRRRLS